MNKPKIFRAFAYALFATAFVSAGTFAIPPVAAYAADEVEVTDSMAQDGVIQLNTNSANYVVKTTLTKPIRITVQCTLTFEDGAKLELNDGAHDAIQVYTAWPVTIKNAQVVQNAANWKALRVDNSNLITLDNCDFSVVGNSCIDVQKGNLRINGGTYKKTQSNGVALIRSNDSLTINDGTFVTSGSDACINKSGSNDPSVNGGSFSSLDVAGYVDWESTSKVFAKGESGLWDLAEDSDDHENDYYYVKLTSNNRAIGYFATEAEANSFAALVSGSQVAPITFKVDFELDGGNYSSDFDAQTVNKGGTANKPANNPTKNGCEFVMWADSLGNEFDFTAAVLKDQTVTAVWKVTNPVASCDGVEYASLQEAFSNAKDNSTVKLLANVDLGDNYGDGGACAYDIQNLTVDLNGKTITMGTNGQFMFPVLAFDNCNGLSVRYGSIEAKNAYAIQLESCENYELSTLDVEVTDGKRGSAIYALRSTGKITSGFYSVTHKSYPALSVYGGSVEIKGGAFVGVEDEDNDSFSQSVKFTAVSADDTMTVTGGDFFGEIVKNAEASLSISGGTFDGPWNIDSIISDYAMICREADNGRYSVVKVDDEGIPAEAFWSLTFTAKGDIEEKTLGVIYYEDKADAQEFIDSWGEIPDYITYKLERLRCKVSFQSRGDIVSTTVVRTGKALGELPAGEEIPGWTFSGWYLGDTKVDASFVPTDDVTLVAKWVKDGSSDESDDPEGKGSKDEKDESKKAIPQTGDTTSAAIPVCLAIGAVILCALGLFLRFRNSK